MSTWESMVFGIALESVKPVFHFGAWAGAAQCKAETVHGRSCNDGGEQTCHSDSANVVASRFLADRSDDPYDDEKDDRTRQEVSPVTDLMSRSMNSGLLMILHCAENGFIGRPDGEGYKADDDGKDGKADPVQEEEAPPLTGLSLELGPKESSLNREIRFKFVEHRKISN